jgi:hypothetical protein
LKNRRIKKYENQSRGISPHEKPPNKKNEMAAKTPKVAVLMGRQ